MEDAECAMDVAEALGVVVPIVEGGVDALCHGSGGGGRREGVVEI